MATLLENFVITHPEVTLSHTDYGRHFNLGNGINILSAPTQRLQSFVEEGGTPYRFIVVGQLASFKVIEDSFGHFISVNLGQPQSTSLFTEIFRGQMRTLHNIEEEDGKKDDLHDQRAQWRTSNGHLAFRAYNASNHPLSSTDLGALMLAVVELRCLDVGHSLTPSAFSRTYWIEALTFRSLSTRDPTDEQFIQRVMDVL